MNYLIQESANNSPWAKYGQLPAFRNKVTGTQLRSSVYMLSTAAVELQWQSSVVATEQSVKYLLSGSL